MPESTVIISPFGIEADHPRSSDLLIQCIPGVRLRSTISAMKTVKNKRGEDVIPIDQAMGLSQFPVVPGMQLHVDPEKLTYIIIDPLYGSEELCTRISKWMREKAGFAGKVEGQKQRGGRIDNEHRMKSLCREMRNLVDAGEARQVKGSGPIPDMQEIDELPGKYLLNPGLRTQTTQPMFEEDWGQWLRDLQKSGG